MQLPKSPLHRPSKWSKMGATTGTEHRPLKTKAAIRGLVYGMKPWIALLWPFVGMPGPQAPKRWPEASKSEPAIPPS